MVKYEILVLLFFITTTIGVLITFFLKIKKAKIWYAFLISWVVWLLFFLIFVRFVSGLTIANMQNSYYKDVLFTLAYSFLLEPVHHVLAVVSLPILFYFNVESNYLTGNLCLSFY